MDGGDLEAKLARFLFDYRVTPHSTTGIAPSELLMHRHLKTRLHLIKPDVSGQVAAQQTKQKGMHDRHAKARFFAPGDAAYALRYHGNKESWVHGSIVEQTGPLSYIVRLDDGSVVRRHVDQLQRGITSPPVAPPTLRVPIEVRQPLQLQEDVESSGEPNSSSPSVSLDSPAPDQRLNCSSTPVPVTEPRRSLRFRKQPDRLEL